MSFECKNHPGGDAAWMCMGCEGLFCNDCTTLRKFGRTTGEICKDCGELCNPVQGAITVEEVGFPEAAADAFAYPVRGFGPVILLGGTAFATFVEAFGGVFGWLFGWGLLLGYGMEVIRTTANGSAKAPDWPDFNGWINLLRPTFLAMATAVMAFGPALYAGMHEKPLLGVGLIVAGAFYAPMAWIAASISGNFAAITPITVLPLMQRVNARYWMACSVLIPFFVCSELGLDVMRSGVSGVLGIAMTTLVGFYLLMVEMRMLGWAWNANRDELGLD